ncbi:MAG: hypothetical protein BMS9Abin01_2702 [Gammaproteobacteria bacterium]|nr:MAG: hypothetical protein BMS9Abin01_2702 [Gammaproteobacteria bacterium]
MNYHYSHAITTNSSQPPAATLSLQIGKQSRSVENNAHWPKLAFMQLYNIIVAYNAGKRAIGNDQDFLIYAASIRIEKFFQ